MRNEQWNSFRWIKKHMLQLSVSCHTLDMLCQGILGRTTVIYYGDLPACRDLGETNYSTQESLPFQGSLCGVPWVGDYWAYQSPRAQRHVTPMFLFSSTLAPVCGLLVLYAVFLFCYSKWGQGGPGSIVMSQLPHPQNIYSQRNLTIGIWNITNWHDNVTHYNTVTLKGERPKVGSWPADWDHCFRQESDKPSKYNTKAFNGLATPILSISLFQLLKEVPYNGS